MVTFSLDDNQLRQICVLAEPLPPPLRSELLRMTAIELGGKEPGLAPYLKLPGSPLTKRKAERFDAMKPAKTRGDLRPASRDAGRPPGGGLGTGKASPRPRLARWCGADRAWTGDFISKRRKVKRFQWS